MKKILTVSIIVCMIFVSLLAFSSCSIVTDARMKLQGQEVVSNAVKNTTDKFFSSGKLFSSDKRTREIVEAATETGSVEIDLESDLLESSADIENINYKTYFDKLNKKSVTQMKVTYDDEEFALDTFVDKNGYVISGESVLGSDQAYAIYPATLSEKHGTPVYGGEYRYLDSDFEKLSLEPQIRVGLDGVVRSSVYCFTAMQIDARRVCLMTKRIGMTEDRSVTDHAALPYVELSDVRLETVPVPVDNRAAHCIEMVFIDQSGRERFRLPIHGDCNDEETVERLCDLIRKSAEEEI